MIYVDSVGQVPGAALTNVLSWPHPIAANDVAFIVDVGSTLSPVTSVTYRGQAMALLRTDTSGLCRNALYYGIGYGWGPGTVSVNFSSSLGLVIGGSISLANVDQDDPIFDQGGQAGTVLNSSISVNMAAQGAAYQGIYTATNSLITPGAAQILEAAVSDAINLQGLDMSILYGQVDPSTGTTSFGLASSVLAASGAISLRPKLAPVHPQTERPIDPTVPSAAIGLRHTVVGY